MPRDFSAIEQVLCVAIVLARCWSPGNYHAKPGQPPRTICRQAMLPRPLSSEGTQLAFSSTFFYYYISSFLLLLFFVPMLPLLLLQTAVNRKICSEQSLQEVCKDSLLAPLALPLSLSLYPSLSLSPAMLRFFCRFCTLPFAASVFHNLACRSAQFSHILTAPCPLPAHAPFSLRAVGNPFAQGAHNFELS